MANGMGNRVLFACVHRSQLLPNGGRPHPDELGEITATLRSALATAKGRGHPIGRTDEAEERWGQLYEEMADHLPAEDSP